MSHIISVGGLCNAMIKNIAGSILAKRKNLNMTYSSYDYYKEIINDLGIELYSGKNEYDSFLYISNSNYIELLEGYSCSNLWAMEDEYFQTKEITNIIYNHLNESENKQRIFDHNKFNYRYNNNNDCFIHIRLRDVEKSNPGFEYYDKAISLVGSIDNIYVGTDDTSHEIIKKLQEKYSNVNVLSYNELDTIQFGSTTKNIILSHGSFSAMIGYLSFYSIVHYPAYNLAKQGWFGDINSIPGWIEVGGCGL